MAERTEVSQDVNTLQRRGRRRLVGAIALVLLAVIVLPMVFDPDPKPAPPPVNVRIPAEDDGKFVPKVVPKGSAVPQAEPKPAASEPKVAEAPQPASPQAMAPDNAAGKAAEKTVLKAPEKPESKPEAKPAAKPAARPAEKVAEKPAEKPVPKPVTDKPAATAVAAGQFYVQVGAFSDAEKVREITDKLKGARLAHYTEPVATAKGPVTRVRLGPFTSKEAAEKARDGAKALGLSPANPVAK